MKKSTFLIGGISIALCCHFSLLFASYEPNDKDFKIIDGVESKIFDLVDSGKIQPETVIVKIHKLSLKNTLSERAQAILAIISEDIDYQYDISAESVDQSFEMTPDECYSDEYFNYQKKVCLPLENQYQNSNSTEIDLSSTNKIDLNKNLGEKVDASGSTEGIYSIHEDLISIQSGLKDKKHFEIWNFFTKIIPSFYRKDLKLYSVFNNPQDDVFAAVSQDNQDNSFWDIEVNKALFYNENGAFDTKESVHTLIHEFAHILTLGKTQVDYLPGDINTSLTINRFKEKCKASFITEGCLKQGSYLEQFIKSFWTQQDVTATEENQKDVLTGHENDFVTEYAASNAAEDIAETFTFFVLQPKPVGNSIAEKKIRFFYDYKELIDLRTVIRNRIN